MKNNAEMNMEWLRSLAIRRIDLSDYMEYGFLDDDMGTYEWVDWVYGRIDEAAVSAVYSVDAGTLLEIWKSDARVSVSPAHSNRNGTTSDLELLRLNLVEHVAGSIEESDIH